MSDLVLDERPPLRRPALLVAFSGWPDAAEAASRAIGFLRADLRASRIGEIAPQGFYDLATSRPKALIRGGVVRGLEYPSSSIYAWRNPDPHGRDLLLLQASEPSLRWPAYIEAVLELIAAFEAPFCYSLGSLFDGVPHTRPTRVSMAVAQPRLRPRLARLGIGQVEYEGPSSVHTALLDGCRKARVLAASLWGHVPAYAQVNWNARVSLRLLEAVSLALELDLDLSRLQSVATQVDSLLDRLVESDEDLLRQVQIYEERYAADEAAEEPASTLPPTEVILGEVEALLRAQRDEADDEDE